MKILLDKRACEDFEGVTWKSYMGDRPEQIIPSERLLVSDSRISYSAIAEVHGVEIAFMERLISENLQLLNLEQYALNAIKNAESQFKLEKDFRYKIKESIHHSGALHRRAGTYGAALTRAMDKQELNEHVRGIPSVAIWKGQFAIYFHQHIWDFERSFDSRKELSESGTLEYRSANRHFIY